MAIILGRKPGGTGGGGGGPPSGPAGGDLGGTYPNPTVVAVETDAVDTAGIQDEAVTEDKVGSGAASSGDVLTADGAGGATWEAAASGAMAVLFDSTLGSAQASFNATGLSGAYRDLLIELSLTPASGGNGDVYLRFNGDTGSNYDWDTGYMTGAIGGANTATSDSKIKMDTLDTTLRYVARIHVSDYADTGIHKYVIAQAHRIAGAAFSIGARWKSNSAITQVTISLSSGNLQAGSRCRIYGIPAV